MKSQLSYAYGVTIARQLTERGIEIDLDEFRRGYEAVAKGEEIPLSDAEIQGLFRRNQRLLAEESATGEGLENVKAGNALWAENLKKAGLETTPSGLQYEILKDGDGAQPESTDEVTVHYTGKLTDGTVFDSSVERGEPASFPLDRVIAGWTEGLQLMKEGAKYRFYIPYDLAYGEEGRPGSIPPYSTLVFDVELLSVNK